MNLYSAHIGYLYKELPLVDRPAAAARDAFTAVEHPEPFDIPACEMRARLDDFRLAFSQISSGMGDASRGSKGLAAIRGREADFREGFKRTLDYAQSVGARFVHPMAGVPGGSWLDTGETCQANLGWAIGACGTSGVSVLVEAITIPGYYLGSLSQAASLHDAFDGRISLLIDTYHVATLLVDPAEWIGTNIGRIGHVHIADFPGRNEPGTGTTTASVAFLSEWKRLAAAASASRIHAGANQ